MILVCLVVLVTSVCCAIHHGTDLRFSVSDPSAPHLGLPVFTKLP